MQRNNRTTEQPEDRHSAGVVGTYTTEIDGLTYHTKTLTATEALRLLPRLILVLGQAGLAVFLKAGVEGLRRMINEESEVAAALLQDAAERLAEEGGDSLDALAKALLAHTTCDQVQIGEHTRTAPLAVHYFDSHFSRRYRHLLEVCLWVGQLSFDEP